MKARCNLMIYAGIDIAKLNHFAAAISSDGKILINPFKFTNDADGFQLLISKLESFEKGSTIIGLESTAHYGAPPVRYLVAGIYKVYVLNPIKTSKMRKNNIRKTKTDKVDTYVIAKILMIQDSLRFVDLYDLNLMGLKSSWTLSPENAKTANPPKNPTDVSKKHQHLTELLPCI